MTVSQQCLDVFKGETKNVLHSLVIDDETRIRHYTPDTKVQSKERITRGETDPKKAMTIS